jgi:hypothetical protein
MAGDKDVLGVEEEMGRGLEKLLGEVLEGKGRGDTSTASA